MNLSELLGFLGTGLVIVAYVPQVHHVIKEHCSAGISVRAYDIWFLASFLFLIHAVMIEDLVFTIVQMANLVAIGVVLVCVRRFRMQTCRTHLETQLKQLEAPRLAIVQDDKRTHRALPSVTVPSSARRIKDRTTIR